MKSEPLAVLDRHSGLLCRRSQMILRHAKIQTTLDLYTQEDCDETLAAQGEYLTALGVGTQMVQ